MDEGTNQDCKKKKNPNTRISSVIFPYDILFRLRNSMFFLSDQ